MTETTTNAPWPSLPEDDLLAYSHVQSLSKIQDQIAALRTAIPALLTPLLRPVPAPTVLSARRASQDTKLQSEDRSVEFRKQATKVQTDVKSLVTDLEKICDTLEAAEKVRNADYNEKGELVRTDPLQRTNVMKEVDEGIITQSDALNAGIVAADVGASGLVANGEAGIDLQQNLAAPLASDAYLFGDEPIVGDGTGNVNADMLGNDINMDVFGTNGYDDFGLESYGNDWADMNFSGELNQQQQQQS